METAVKWYNSKVIELMTQREQENIDVLEFRNQLDLLLTEAKQMEKEQHDNTAEEWWKQGAHYMESGGTCKWESFEQYYNETFKSE